MKEKQMQVFFRDHVKKHPPETSEIYELKICKGTSLPFDNVAPHQIEALLQAHTGSVFHKIQDQPIYTNMKTRFNLKKPFDCLIMVKVPAFVVVWFYHAGKKKVFIKIPINVFLQEQDRCSKLVKPRKSMTEQMALEIGEAVEIDTKT